MDTWVCGQNESDVLKGCLVILKFELFLIGIPSTLDIVVYSGSKFVFTNKVQNEHLVLVNIGYISKPMYQKMVAFGD